MRRPLLLGAAWLASAGAAVGLGFLAVSLVGASASPATSPAAVTSSTAATPTDGTAAPTSPRATGEFATVGGTVYANCTDGTPVLAGVPAAGWWVDDSNDPGEMEFENGAQKVEVHVTCAGGSPQFFQEGPRADDGGQDGGGQDDGGQDDSSSSPTSGHDDSGDADDSSGRGSGDDSSGHGSDDSGDDSSGHGSDD
jgi:hypothetical protein